MQSGSKRAVWLGALSLRHPAYADLRAIAAAMAEVTGASLGVLAEGGNAAGAYLAGAVPHREAGGKSLAMTGKTAREMLTHGQRAYLLVGGVEPWVDALTGDARAALSAAANVVAVTPYADQELKRVARVLLPSGTFAESAGTFINLEGAWQSFAGAAKPLGEARPAWKILRVLANLVGVPESEYQSSEQVRDELKRLLGDAVPTSYRGTHVAAAIAGDIRVPDVPMYSIDALLRRAPSLQRTRASLAAAVVHAAQDR
jgi:NADH-quinone oxidoreductase subunit G